MKPLIIPRRSFLIAASLAAAPRAAWANDLSSGAFTHGVASGDPLADSVILWTRFAPASGGGRIAWEIAENDTFQTPTLRGEAIASAASDFCVKVDARGLAPGRAYFYRFLSASGPSVTGRTCTAPAVGGDRLTVGLVSCANYGFGYFHAYAELARRDDVDLVLHTGDYIYEYGADTYPDPGETIPRRAFDPPIEIVRLEDYYRRYAQYHTDPDLLELRRLKPMSAVWDDHEIANDASSTGAQNHQRSEGAYADRVAAAAKAYFDWMPIRRPDASSARLYRSLDWGDLARIALIDTRYIGRVRQLDYRSLGFSLLNDGEGAVRNIEEFRRTQLEDPSRTLLGAAQETWLAETFAQSKQRGQTWQIVAQQIAIGEQLIGPGAIAMLAEGAHGNTRRYVSVAERLGRLGMPWNLDAWDGYPAARTRFLQTCVTHANNVVALGGDSHNTWLNNLSTPGETRIAALEFAGASVTSPGLERTLSNAAPGARETMMRQKNPQRAWCDMTNRGFGVLRFTRTACEAEWVAVSDVSTPERGASTITRMAAEPSASAGPGAWVVP